MNSIVKHLTARGIIKKLLRNMMLIAFSAAVTLTSSTATAGDTDKRKPNLIYILADDAGIGDFGAYGQQEIETPNLDKMANEGMVFTNHYAGSTVCAPSRSSLLTGQHTGHTQVRGNIEVLPEGQMPLRPDNVSLAKLLKDTGMKTGAIGKWGLGGAGSEGVPNNHGFDYWFGYLCQREAHDYYPDHLWQNDQKVELNGNYYAHDLFTEEALNFIKRHHQDSFFLYLPYTIPHAKLQVPDPGPYANKDWNDDKKKYAAMITRMDSDIGRIFALLAELKIDGNTLVMFSSDNGPHAEGGADPDFFHSSGSFKGKKRDLYEGGIRVPLIGRWPGRIEAGSVSDHVSAFWDILPTFAELAEASVPEGIDGISMVPGLLGNPSAQKSHDYLYWEFHERAGSQAVRLDHWKGIRHNVRDDPDGPIELYNLSSDPGEMHDLAELHPAIVKQIATIMTNARTVSADFPLLGKDPLLRFGPYNAWLFSIALLVSGVLLFLIARPGNRVEMFRTFWAGTFFEKLMIFVSWLLALFLYTSSAYLALWGESVYFNIGLYLSLLGLAGYLICQLQFYFKRPGNILVKGFYRYTRNPKELFVLVFWSGVAIATMTLTLFWVLLCYAVIRYFIIRLEEKVCLVSFESDYQPYKDKVSRYLFGF